MNERGYTSVSPTRERGDFAKQNHEEGTVPRSRFGLPASLLTLRAACPLYVKKIQKLVRASKSSANKKIGTHNFVASIEPPTETLARMTTEKTH
jgi:hypothetical protein